MKDRFFDSALKAAKQDAEIFAAELKKIGADANVKEYSDKYMKRYGDPLIHCIIRDISDQKLPALLNVISPRKNGHSTKRPFALQNIQGLSNQVQNEDAFDYSKYRYTQTHDFLHLHVF
jgi:hypothetical protein